MDTLSTEIVMMILSHTDTSTRLNWGLVCWGWRELLPVCDRSASRREYINSCARDGNVTYLAPQKQYWDKDTISSAIEGKRVGCLAYLVENGCPHMRGHVREACICSSNDCLGYLLELGYESGIRDTIIVVSRNNLGGLKQLHRNWCVWDESVVRMAACVGSLECVEYLCTHGCPWDVTSIITAMRLDNLDCADYLIDLANEHSTSRDNCSDTLLPGHLY